jgi:hypothetical protein
MLESWLLNSYQIPHSCRRNEHSIESGSRSFRRRWYWHCRHAWASGRTGEAATTFVISNIEVTDPAGYQKYGEAAVRFANDR